MSTMSEVMDKKFLVIHVGTYGRTNIGYLPAEFAIAEFSIRDGIIDSYSQTIHPGVTPLGAACTVKIAVEENGYDYPDKGHPPGDYVFTSLVRALEQILLMGKRVNADASKPCKLYTLDEHLVAIQGCIEWMAGMTGIEMEHGEHYKLCPLPRLLSNMFLYTKRAEFLRYSKIQLQLQALAIINRTEFSYMKQLSCETHRENGERLNIDKYHKCSRTIVHSWILNCLSSLAFLPGANKDFRVE